MANRIIIARTWCEEHLAQCYQSYNENTGENKHIGDKDSIFPNTDADFLKEKERLHAQGYQASRPNGVWTFTQWKAAPLALPLEWQMLAESKEPEQDW